MKSRIAKKTEGYGYKYTELADINKYCEDNGIRYYQETETSEINQKDYIITYLDKNGEITKHRGCQIVQATLQGIKNPVQEYGSSLTYCRRYSLLMALGLATEDDDAQSLSEPKVIEMDIIKANNYTLSFGKHKGKKISELDKGYIEWLLNNSNDDELLMAIEMVTGQKKLTDEENQELIDLMDQMDELIEKTGTDKEDLYEYFKVENNTEMTIEQFKEAIEILKKKEGK